MQCGSGRLNTFPPLSWPVSDDKKSQQAPNRAVGGRSGQSDKVRVRTGVEAVAHGMDGNEEKVVIAGKDLFRAVACVFPHKNVGKDTPSSAH